MLVILLFITNFKFSYSWIDRDRAGNIIKESTILNNGNLYSSLYELDNMKNIDIILSSLVEDTLIGRTINNRLIKSAEDNDEN